MSVPDVAKGVLVEATPSFLSEITNDIDVELTPASAYTITPTNDSTKAVLLAYPSGVYTVARTVRGSGVHQLDAHLKRIVEGCRGVEFNRGAAGETHKHAMGEPAEIATAMQPFRDPLLGARLVRSAMGVALREWRQASLSRHDVEAKIAVLVTYDKLEKRARLICHVDALFPPASQPVGVMVDGPPRQNAAVKDTQWIRDRTHLERHLSSEISEVVLYDAVAGTLYEGLTTNLCVLTSDPIGGHAYLASAPAGTVLEGTMLRLVHQVCGEMGLEVRRECLAVETRGSWKAAFLTSVAKPVVEVGLMRFADGSREWVLETGDEVVREIRRRVREHLTKLETRGK
ncbi:uncharacterized protein EV422DRAFT_177787 [Fimicolochytrium jonesii]|uniref:uncharacterized protein n=1 Tax=Fimicolochytrium jonesii TaxID=1396493 RepID=UPI0022FF32DA|nr:uncharacterized protein EV422DRAFT_177787 [Fimicolochytrium jonesii]KAI8818296.1 hypothetical protein EV422DRAFT_177787 [Fimicolochytrium jonesii]